MILALVISSQVFAAGPCLEMLDLAKAVSSKDRNQVIAAAKSYRAARIHQLDEQLKIDAQSVPPMPLSIFQYVFLLANKLRERGGKNVTLADILSATHMTLNEWNGITAGTSPKPLTIAHLVDMAPLLEVSVRQLVEADALHELWLREHRDAPVAQPAPLKSAP